MTADSDAHSGDVRTVSLLDACGILDIYILKIWQLFLASGFPGERTLFFNELAFALSRGTGELYYVAATREACLEQSYAEGTHLRAVLGSL